MARLMLKRLILTILWLSMAGCFGAGLCYWSVARWTQQNIALPSPIIVEFPRGTRLTGLSDSLAAQGVIDSPLYFQIWTRIQRNYHRFQAGTYRFENSVSPRTVIQTIIKGDTYRPIVAQVTIPEGFNTRQIAARLAETGIGTTSEFMKLTGDKEFLRQQKITAATIEGYLYPATYNFYSVPTLRDAITEMVQQFWQRLPKGYAHSVDALGLSIAQAITFASLIELETKFEDEKPMVSEVIWRRLKNNEPLGIDAALIYGIDDYDGDIKWKHLRDAKNPYNLRIHTGLPPTPIGSPALSSLQAVLTPTNEGYHFYVLKVGTGGRHHFSKTLAEHNRYVKELVRSASNGQK